ncbi:MFS transporter [Pedobacter chitinilyticus]|uniref:MFS transporter n=1 Tax=Pedobacter chitinilyticus TaxID=2233776 RepID=A0A3S3STN2_9SPHI|nr:MFS transporter [Pedobacter chitinilyticus]RWU10103.1 MFS transporter [Pedobacter chitinilyticus]
MKTYIQSYFKVYQGLSTPAWMLALVMLVNRSGAMVVPFLGVYMVKHLGFSLESAGLLLSCFGIGSVVGSSLGGWLTDKFGHFKVQLFSLVGVIPLFVLLPELTTTTSLAGGILALSMVSDILRPANSVSLAYYSKPENVVRSFTLNRMALNLGFSIGPALGGLLAAISYNLLFYGNAIAATLAAVIFFVYFRNKKGEIKEKVNTGEEELKYQSPYKDAPFLVFTFLSILFAICFFQLLSSLPLYYKEVYHLNEKSIGVILAYSGVVVFSLEMLIVHIAERRTTAANAIIIGVFCCGVAFASLLITEGIWLLYVSMFILCIAEILAMPFMATVTLQRSNIKNRGAYMGLNSLSLSAGLIFAPFLGTKIAANYGFNVLWMGTGALMLLTSIGFYLLMKRMKLKAQ